MGSTYRKPKGKPALTSIQKQGCSELKKRKKRSNLGTIDDWMKVTPVINHKVSQLGKKKIP